VDLPVLAVHAVTVAGWAVPVGVVLRYSPRAAHAVLWLVAGIIVIFGRSERPQVERALDFVKELGGLDLPSLKGRRDTPAQDDAGSD
jgi:hypothetical protein